MIDTHPVLNTSMTKKKQANFLFIPWIIGIVFFIGLGFLFAMIEIFKMQENKTYFFNIKVSNLDIPTVSGNKKYLTDSTPVFLFTEDKVIFGQAKHLLIPKSNDEVMTLDKATWQNDFANKIKSSKYTSGMFPALSIAVVFKNEQTYSDNVQLVADASKAIYNQNIIYEGNNSNYQSDLLSGRKKAKNADLFPVILFPELIDR